MCFSDYEGKRKGIRLAGHGASEAEEVAGDADLKPILFLTTLYSFFPSFEQYDILSQFLIHFVRAYTVAIYLSSSEEN